MRTIKVFQTTTHQDYARNVLAAFNMEVFVPIEDMHEMYNYQSTEENDKDVLDEVTTKMKYPIRTGDIVCIEDVIYRYAGSRWFSDKVTFTLPAYTESSSYR